MKSASFQCPDSGLIVIVDTNGRVSGDPDDWEEMGADQDSIDATYAWMGQFRRALTRQFGLYGSKRQAAFDTAARECNLDPSDLDELTWG